jgi:hypothetical protein
MSPSRARYVTACQQLLALGVVVMALVPATRVVSLDVVGVGPTQRIAQPTIEVSPTRAVGGSADVGMSGYARAKQRCVTPSLRVAERTARAQHTRAASHTDRTCRGWGSARRLPPGAR